MPLDWETKEWNQPRVFTLKNIRDIFFTLMNFSKTQERVCDGETNIHNLWEKTAQLTAECERIDKKLDQTRKDLDKQHETFYQEYTENSCKV